jgi:hypothetical protein
VPGPPGCGPRRRSRAAKRRACLGARGAGACATFAAGVGCDRASVSVPYRPRGSGVRRRAAPVPQDRRLVHAVTHRSVTLPNCAVRHVEVACLHASALPPPGRRFCVITTHHSSRVVSARPPSSSQHLVPRYSRFTKTDRRSQCRDSVQALRASLSTFPYSTRTVGLYVD